MDKFETQDIKCGQMLTSKQFVKLFNSISENYRAELKPNGDITIADRDDYLYLLLYNRKPSILAKLRFDSQFWLFEYERAYSWQELTLITQLAATSPMFRNPPKEREND